MGFKKFRWSQVYESSEEELVSLLQVRNLDFERIHIESDTPQTENHTDSIITIWCAEGSSTVKAGATSVSMQPGDALRLEPNNTYSIRPGIAGCTYYLTI